jgi:Peptidase family M48
LRSELSDVTAVRSARAGRGFVQQIIAAVGATAATFAKMTLGEEVLAYHGRRGVITFTIIRVTSAFIGLTERAVILVSANVLPLLNREEFAALVAHEIGHEYVWADYWRAERRHDHARIRELELRCDGIAIVTLRRLGLDLGRLIEAVEILTSYSRELRLDDNAADYAQLRERRAFIRAVEQLHWADRQSSER